MSASALDKFPEIDIVQLQNKLTLPELDQFLRLIGSNDTILQLFDVSDVPPTTQGMIDFVRQVLHAANKRAKA